jgi:hypothetical protein
MNRPNRVSVPATVVRRNKPWTIRGGAQPAQAPTPRSRGLTRRYEVTWVDDDGAIENFTRVAPAIPIFEQAFSAFAHGAVIATEDGPVAVEDLVPGMMIETAAGTAERLRWVGAMTLIPGAPVSDDQPQCLYRVTADALGLGRPSTDVTFGPSARLVNRDPAIRNALGSEAALAPVSTFEDGVSVVALTPASPVRVYHLAFDGHQIIHAGGMEVESYHPGPDAHYSMSQELRAVFLSLFPHMETLQGFGRVLWPRFETNNGDEFELV